MSFCLHFVYLEHTHHEFTFFSLFLLQCFVDDWDDHFTQWQGTATALGCGTLHEPERMKSLVSLILVSSCLGKWKSAVCKIHSNDNYSYRMYCLSSKTSFVKVGMDKMADIIKYMVLFGGKCEFCYFRYSWLSSSWKCKLAGDVFQQLCWYQVRNMYFLSAVRKVHEGFGESKIIKCSEFHI